MVDDLLGKPIKRDICEVAQATGRKLYRNNIALCRDTLNVLRSNETGILIPNFSMILTYIFHRVNV